MNATVEESHMYYIVEDEYGYHWMLERENPCQRFFIPQNAYIWLYSWRALQTKRK